MKQLLDLLKELPPDEPTGLEIGFYDHRWVYWVVVHNDTLDDLTSSYEQVHCLKDLMQINPVTIHIWAFYKKSVRPSGSGWGQVLSGWTKQVHI